MLTGSQIARSLFDGDLVIDPYDPTQLGPNSYDLKLQSEIIEYAAMVLDPKVETPTVTHRVPPSGLVLYPGRLYIASTVEKTGSMKYVPVLHGRSSAGRLGLSCHTQAGLGDIGWFGQWTLEITVVLPVRIYPEMSICQVVFEEVTGETELTYRGKYQNQTGPTTHRSWIDYTKDGIKS